MSSPIILGIDPGARQIGISILKGDNLLFYAVKTIKRPGKQETIQKLWKVIEAIMAEYKIEFAAIEKIVFVQQHQSFVKTVYEEIKDFFKQKNIQLFEYNPKLTRKIICGLEKPKKRNVALRLSQKYPELARYSNVARVWQRRYFAPLFDAVAVAFVCGIEIREAKALSANPPSKN